MLGLFFFFFCYDDNLGFHSFKDKFGVSLSLGVLSYKDFFTRFLSRAFVVVPKLFPMIAFLHMSSKLQINGTMSKINFILK